MHLVEDLLRRMRAHACHYESPEMIQAKRIAAAIEAHVAQWGDLDAKTVPSAFVSDDDTRAWSDEMYDRDLDNDRKSRGLLGLIAVGGLIAGAYLGCGVAKATPDLDAYTISSAPAVCMTLDKYPSADGVLGILQAVAADGFTAEQAGEIVARSVIGWCPSHKPSLDAFVAKYGKRVRA